ncbi:hypothetical protein SAMN05444407_104275 [Chryseobacterium contaminans]|uniref:Uncharacterized protein n=1 Tax=Chryseobacterium contaminans TaxID=1423959 RepID=A0A1M7B8X3_9FLAO|nr:hypothetical protein SAMN05444407_104275 [Chryseobacterium contaminans]
MVNFASQVNHDDDLNSIFSFTFNHQNKDITDRKYLFIVLCLYYIDPILHNCFSFISLVSH